MTDKARWHETLHDQFGQYFTVDKVLYQQDTGQQHLIIFENARFGRVMALDGVVQTTESDEFIYHEMLTHVPLLAHGNASQVLIIGGGDGGMLREVCRHKTIDLVMMVEIDGAVVDFCRQYFPGHSAGSYDDPRFKLVIDDGVNFVNSTEQKFDVIISDCTDPDGPGASLFTSEFYQGCKRCLKPGGVFVAQNGVFFLQQNEAIATCRKLQHYFADASFYLAAVPTYYGGAMAFAWASDNPLLRQLSPEIIQARCHQSGIHCRYYNPAIHTAAFALPQYMQDALYLQQSPEVELSPAQQAAGGETN